MDAFTNAKFHPESRHPWSLETFWETETCGEAFTQKRAGALPNAPHWTPSKARTGFCTTRVL